jgi:hypothetical protein
MVGEPNRAVTPRRDAQGSTGGRCQPPDCRLPGRASGSLELGVRDHLTSICHFAAVLTQENDWNSHLQQGKHAAIIPRVEIRAQSKLDGKCPIHNV